MAYTDQEIIDYGKKLKEQGKDEAFIRQFVLAAKAKQNVGQSAPEPEKSVFGKTADVINTGVGAVTKAMDYTGIPQAVGGVVGAAGGLIGGATAGFLTPAANFIKGRPAFENLGANIVQGAKDTASFGYEIGKSGTETAPLGAVGKLGTVGRLANLSVAYGQGYQGAKDVYEGVKEGDPGLALQGGLSLGMAAVAAKTGTSDLGKSVQTTRSLFSEGKPVAAWKSMLLDPEVVPMFQNMAQNAKAKKLQKLLQMRKDAFQNDLYRRTSTEIKNEIRNEKQVVQDLAESGVTPDVIKDGGRLVLDNTKMREHLVPQRDAAYADLQKVLTENPKELSYKALERQMISDWNKYNKNSLQTVREEAHNAIKELVAGEVRKNSIKLREAKIQEVGQETWNRLSTKEQLVEIGNGDKVSSADLNANKAGFWELSAAQKNPSQRTPQQKVAFTGGAAAQKMIEQAYKGEVDIQAKNKIYGRYADMIRFLNASDGRIVPKGSALSKISRGVVGSSIGGWVGNAVGGPVVGALGSAVGAEIGKNTSPQPTVKVNKLQQKINKLNQSKP